MKKIHITFASLIVVLALTPLTIPHWSVASAVSKSFGDGDGEATATEKKKSDNSFAHALGAPFRALAKIFGGKRNQQARRVTEKDIKQFESTKTQRVNDATTAQVALSDGGTGAGIADRVAQGREALERNDLNGAIALLSAAASDDPKLNEAHRLLGVAYCRKGLTQLSTESFERALKLAPRDSQILNDYGYALYVAGNYQQAIKFLKKATKLQPNDKRIWNNLALAQSRLEKYDDALKSFVRAGGEFNGQINVAKMLERAGRDHEAIAHYKIAKQKAESEQQANADAQNVSVAVEIKNGRVINASVPNHQAGMEGYETSALRIARQRRYPSETTGTDLLAVKVNRLPGI